MSPLTNQQKAYLAQLARRAWNLACARARGRREPTPDFDPWRHEQIARACHKHGLTCADQGDYKLIEAHFLDLLGHHAQAFEANLRAATEPKRQAHAVLLKNLQAFRLHISYAEHICRCQSKCELIDATPHQLWRVIYTIRNRRYHKTRTPTLVPAH